MRGSAYDLAGVGVNRDCHGLGLPAGVPLVGARIGRQGAEVLKRVEGQAMNTQPFYLSPRLKLWVDNRVIRPSEKAESVARKRGTKKSAAFAMAVKFARRVMG